MPHSSGKQKGDLVQPTIQQERHNKHRPEIPEHNQRVFRKRPTKTLHKIFNNNTLKLSYGSMPNVKNIISAHNKRLLNEDIKSIC